MSGKHKKDKYTEAEAIESFANESNEDVYRRKAVLYRAASKDSGKLYSDVIAEEILKKYQTLNEVEFEKFLIPENKIVDDTYLDSVEHDNNTTDTNRDEENLAKKVTSISLKSEDNYEIFYYQFPVNRVHRSAEGKVDLLLKKNNVVVIGELKKESSDETLLRTILEIKTYLIKLLRNQTAESRIKDALEGDLVNIIPAVIIASGKGSETVVLNSKNQIKVLNRPKYDFERMKKYATQGTYTALYQLCKSWNIEFFEIVIDKNQSDNKENDYANYQYTLNHLTY